MAEADWVRPALGYSLLGLLTVGSASLALSGMVAHDVSAVLAGVAYALVLGVTSTAATEYCAASTPKPTAEDKWLPEKQTAFAVLAYLAGAAVPLFAGVVSAFHPAAIGGATVTTFAGLGFFSAKVMGRTAAAGVVRVCICRTSALVAGYLVLRVYPRLLHGKVV